MKPFFQFAVIAGIAGAAAGSTYWVKGPPVRRLVCDPSTLKADERCLQEISANEPILWVDARSRKDWEKSGVEGSVLWNLDPTENMQSFESEIASRLMDVRGVVVYCGDENCGVSRQVAARIRALGLADEVWVLRGGWRALHEAGRTRDSSPATSD